MKNNDFEKLQKLYNDGYRCIRYDDVKDENMNIYLQNFDREESTHCLEFSEETDKIKVMDYINKYNSIK